MAVFLTLIGLLLIALGGWLWAVDAAHPSAAAFASIGFGLILIGFGAVIDAVNRAGAKIVDALKARAAPAE